MNNISLAPGVSRVAPSQIREIADAAFSMDGVLKLHFGESSMQTPQYLDEAIVLTPNRPNGSAIVSLFGGYPKEIPLLWNGKRYEINFDSLEKALTPKTRLLVYTSPSNPLGWVADPAEQQALLDFCRHNRLWLLADEVYERIYYAAGVAPSILRLCTRDDAVIVVQSFSKIQSPIGMQLKDE